jgi:hypothetical protein
MGTTRDILKEKREAEAWDAHMARVRAAEREKREWPVYVPPADPEPKKDER